MSLNFIRNLKIIKQMREKTLIAALFFVCLLGFENTIIAQDKNDASFKESIDFVYRYSMKIQERSKERTTFEALSVVDDSTLLVQQIIQIDDIENGAQKVITNQFSMKDIAPTVTIEQRRKTYTVYIGCKIEDCIVHKYTNAKRGKLEKYSGRISQIGFTTEEEATANRIKKALEHAIDLVPEEKF